MNLNQLTKRDKILIFVALGIFFIFLVQKFLFSVMIERSQFLEGQIKLQEADLKAVLEMEQKKDLVRDDLLKYKDYLVPNNNITDDEQIAAFLKVVEAMVRQSGVSIVSLTPQSNSKNDGEYIKYDAQLRIEGTPSKIYNFIYRVQSNKLLIRLNQVTVTPKDHESNLLKLETTISLTLL